MTDMTNDLRGKADCQPPRAWPAHGLGKWEGPGGDKFSRSEDAGNAGRVERRESE